MNYEDIQPFLNCLNTIARSIAPLDGPSTILDELTAIHSSILELDVNLHDKLGRLTTAINRLADATRDDSRNQLRRKLTKKGPRK